MPTPTRRHCWRRFRRGWAPAELRTRLQRPDRWCGGYAARRQRGAATTRTWSSHSCAPSTSRPSLSVYAPGLSPMDFTRWPRRVDGQWRSGRRDVPSAAPDIGAIATGRDAADTAFLDNHKGAINEQCGHATSDGDLPKTLLPTGLDPVRLGRTPPSVRVRGKCPPQHRALTAKNAATPWPSVRCHRSRGTLLVRPQVTGHAARVGVRRTRRPHRERDRACRRRSGGQQPTRSAAAQARRRWVALPRYAAGEAIARPSHSRRPDWSRSVAPRCGRPALDMQAAALGAVTRRGRVQRH